MRLKTRERTIVFRLSAFVLAGCLLMPSQILSASSREDARPSWSVGLDQIGSFDHFLKSALMIPPQVAFISNNRLAISFLNPCPEIPIESSPRLKQRQNEKITCGLMVTVLLVNAKNGEVEGTLTTPFHTVHQSEPSSPPGQGLRLLIPTRAGEFLIHTGDFLLRYGADLEVIEKRPIGNPDRTVVFVSPGGTRVLVNEYESINKFRKFLCPSDHIQTGDLFGVGWPGEGVTDDGNILSFVEKPNLFRQSSDYRRIKNGLTKCDYHTIRGGPFCLALCRAEDDCELLGAHGSLLDNTRMVTTNRERGSHNNSFEIVDRAGKVLYRGRADNFISGFSAGAATAQKLIVRSGKMGVSHGEMTWKFGFDVLDLNQMKNCLRVTLRGSGGTKLRTPDAAISPDGSKVAILVGSDLHFYAIPAKVR